MERSDAGLAVTRLSSRPAQLDQDCLLVRGCAFDGSACTLTPASDAYHRCHRETSSSVRLTQAEC